MKNWKKYAVIAGVSLATSVIYNVFVKPKFNLEAIVARKA